MGTAYPCRRQVKATQATKDGTSDCFRTRCIVCVIMSMEEVVLIHFSAYVSSPPYDSLSCMTLRITAKSQVCHSPLSPPSHTHTFTESGTYAIIFSSLEINVAIICASLLVMKPLFARFLPALVSEQPVSAADDGRTCRALTGLHLLSGGTVDDVEKAQVGGRRDTLIEMNHFVQGIATPRELKEMKKAVGSDKRHTM